MASAGVEDCGSHVHYAFPSTHSASSSSSFLPSLLKWICKGTDSACVSRCLWSIVDIKSTFSNYSQNKLLFSLCILSYNSKCVICFASNISLHVLWFFIHKKIVTNYTIEERLSSVIQSLCMNSPQLWRNIWKLAVKNQLKKIYFLACSPEAINVNSTLQKKKR